MIKFVKDNLGILDIPLRFYFGEHGYHQLRKKGFDIELNTAGYCNMHHGVIYIWFEVTDGGIPYTTIAHESLHVATYAWDFVGADLHFMKNDEVLTYTMTHVMDKVFAAHKLWSKHK